LLRELINTIDIQHIDLKMKMQDDMHSSGCSGLSTFKVGLVATLIIPGRQQAPMIEFMIHKHYHLMR
jgi:hypothetical protein